MNYKRTKQGKFSKYDYKIIAIKKKRTLKTIKILATAITIGLAVVGSQSVYNDAKDKLTEVFKPEVKQAEAVEPAMIDWILTEVEKNGINKTEALMIMQCESKQKPDAYGINVHKNGTTSLDAGIWQINLYYQKISLADALDYKKATAKAIEIYKSRGNSWSAWTCGQKLGLK